jgi:hypothetical protein
MESPVKMIQIFLFTSYTPHKHHFWFHRYTLFYKGQQLINIEFWVPILFLLSFLSFLSIWAEIPHDKRKCLRQNVIINQAMAETDQKFDFFAVNLQVKTNLRLTWLHQNPHLHAVSDVKCFIMIFFWDISFHNLKFQLKLIRWPKIRATIKLLLKNQY